MATLTKSKKAQQRAWRPDFREVQSLPDTKVVRTGFLLNFIAISVTLICLTLFFVKEYSLQSLVSSVNLLEAQVQAETARNRSILDANKRFLQSAEMVEEAVAFDSQPIAYHTFIAEVSGALQEGMVLSKLELASSTDAPGKSGIPPFSIELTGRVLETAPASPSQILSDFQKAIEKLPTIQGKNVQMEMAKFGRNNEAGYFDFTLLIKLAVEKAPSL